MPTLMQIGCDPSLPVEAKVANFDQMANDQQPL